MAKAKKPASTRRTPSKATDQKAGSEAPKTTAAAKASGAAEATVSKTVESSSKVKPEEAASKADGVKKAEPVSAEKQKADTPAPKPDTVASKPTTSGLPKVSKAAEPAKAAEGPANTKGEADKPKEPETKTSPEAISKPEMKTPAQTAPAPAPQPEKRGSVFWPLVLGGLLAGGAGYAVSEYNLLNTRSDGSELRETLAKQQEQIAALENAEPVSIDLTGIESSLASLSQSTADLEARLVELENRPLVSVDDGVPQRDYSAEFARLQASVQEQKAEIDGLLKNAQSVEEATANAAKQAAVQTALAKITAALSSGTGFAGALADMSANGVADIPEVLSTTADDGVPTLLSLQTAFPGVARAGLSAARATGTDGNSGGIGGFFLRQLGARSVAPREGSDPDAVLSRGEAALREGRVADALIEFDTLPPEVQAVMQDWLTDAGTRAAATAAVQDLSQRLTAN